MVFELKLLQWPEHAYGLKSADVLRNEIEDEAFTRKQATRLRRGTTVHRMSRRELRALVRAQRGLGKVHTLSIHLLACRDARLMIGE